jgi:hypothetical protein
VARQKITLASGSLRKSLPIDEEVEMESEAGDLDDIEAEPAGIETDAEPIADTSSEPPQSV